MAKEIKSEYFHFKLTPSLKKKIYERSAELGKEPAVYVRDLITKDCASNDMTEAEKPRMKEFAQLIANEFNQHLNETLLSSIEDLKESTELNNAISCWSHRHILNTFVNLAMRINSVGNLKEEDLKNINNDSAKKVNSMYNKFLEIVLSKNSTLIMEYLKKPIA